MTSENAQKIAGKYGYLPETIERFLQLFGKEFTLKMLEAYEREPPTTIRINTLLTSKTELLERLSTKGFVLEPSSEYNLGYIVKESSLPLGATTEYLAGHYFIQSKASWLPSLILNPKSSDIVIDLAAAPGGKATHLAQLMGNKGTLLCLDISSKRIKSLRSNLNRCGVENVITIRTDGRKVPEFKIHADKILLDAPCTGEGLMGIDSKRRLARNHHDIQRLSKLQKELLEAGLRSLKINGTLVYSTCSTAPEENEEVIDWAVTKFPVRIEDIDYQFLADGLTAAFGKQYNSDISKAKRLYPHMHKTEGFFVCKMTLLEDMN